MPTVNIVLVEPQIPQNTGNVARTCAVTGARLHLVGPMGFTIDDKKLKRAGLDYWGQLDITYYQDLDAFFAANHGPFFYFTSKGPRRHVDVQAHGLENALDQQLIAQAQVALEHGQPQHISMQARNVHRSVGAMLSGELIRRHPDGLPDGCLQVQFEGTGGQSFGAFLARGITFDLTGQANDYTGKGLSGGRLVVHPHTDFKGNAAQNIIVGNTVLYGATSGEAFFAGVAGERFAVRLSGASAVVEGTGDHGCEYMTGGTVLVLGATGRNFAAGMSGGVAYVYDADGSFAGRCNLAQVALDAVLPAAEQIAAGIPLHQGEADEALLLRLLQQHHTLTDSAQAAALLAQWPAVRSRFVKVFPHEYRRALSTQQASTATAQEAALA